jgi:hypothetical protein
MCTLCHGRIGRGSIARLFICGRDDALSVNIVIGPVTCGAFCYLRRSFLGQFVLFLVQHSYGVAHIAMVTSCCHWDRSAAAPGNGCCISRLKTLQKKYYFVGRFRFAVFPPEMTAPCLLVWCLF